MNQPNELTAAETKALLYAMAIDEDDPDELSSAYPVLMAVTRILDQRAAHLERPIVRIAELDLPPDGRPSISYWPKDAKTAADIVRGIPADWAAEKTGTIESLRCHHEDVAITIFLSAPIVEPDRTAPHATAILDETRHG